MLPAAIALLMSAPHAWAGTIRLLVLGDSLAAGYGLAHADGFEAQLEAALRARGRDVRIVDAAVSGDTTAGGLARLDWALADGADAAIECVGDWVRGHPQVEERGGRAGLGARGGWMLVGFHCRDEGMTAAPKLHAAEQIHAEGPGDG